MRRTNSRLTKQRMDEKFWSHVAIIPFHECWEWVGRTSGKDGYGRFFLGSGKSTRAHRYSYAITKTLKEGLFIDHICRNRNCVNPQHLRAVTPRINAIENSVGPTAINKSKTNCIRGHPFNIKNTYLRKRDGYLTRVCRACDNARTKNKTTTKTKIIS